MFFEESLIFFPSKYPQGLWDTEAIAQGGGVIVEDHFFATEDEHRLHGWWVATEASRAAGTDPVVLIFHGNAGNLSDRAGFVLDVARLGVQVVIVDYRGYGRSEGRPNERGIYLDADASWRFLTVENDVAPARVVLFGKSLGGAAAVDLATRVRPGGVVLQSCFTSVPDMAAWHYPFIPRILVRTKMDNLAKIVRVNSPVMVVHSTADEVVPFAMGQKLFAAAGEPKRFFVIQGAGHNNTIAVGGRGYLEALKEFFHQVCGPKP